MIAKLPGRFFQRKDEGIVFGVARSVKPRSKSASDGAKPGGFKAPATIPSSLGVNRWDSFRSRSVRKLKDSLLIPKEFLNAKKLQTPQGAKINSPR